MSLNLSSATLRSLLSLTERREALLNEVNSIEAQISAALSGVTASPTTAEVAPRPRKIGKGKGGKRGAMKEIVLAALREAGEAGIMVKDLAVKIGAKPQNVHVWMHTTGKKNGLVKAVGKGVYRLEEAVGVATPSADLEAPKPKVTEKKASKPRKKRASKAGK